MSTTYFDATAQEDYTIPPPGAASPLRVEAAPSGARTRTSYLRPPRAPGRSSRADQCPRRVNWPETIPVKAKEGATKAADLATEKTHA